MLKKLIPLLMAAFFTFGYSQTTDLEAGIKGNLGGPKTPYLDLRFNYQVGPQILGQDVYAVLEPGIMLLDKPILWMAGEIIVDGSASTEFLRLEYTDDGGLYMKAGIRLGFGE